MQLYLKRKLGPRPPRGAATRGTSFHKAVEVNFAEKVAGGLDAPLDVCTDAYRDTFHERLLDTDWQEEDPRQMFNEGIVMVKTAHQDLFPPIYPRSEEDVERKLIIDCGDFLITGTTDFVDVNDMLVDWKTASRRWAKSKAAKEVQGFLYPLGIMLEDLEIPYSSYYDDDLQLMPAVFVVVTKKGATEAHLVEHRLGQAKAIIEMARSLVRMLREGNPIVNPGNFLCSAKWCAYHSFCPVMRGEFLET